MKLLPFESFFLYYFFLPLFVSNVEDRKSWGLLESIAHMCFLGDYNMVVKVVIWLIVHLQNEPQS